MHRHAFFTCVPCVLICLLLVASANAQSTPVADSKEDVAAKEQALKWIDRFAAEQVLFSPRDVEKLREKVGKMTETEATAWWDKSASHRELFDSKDWQETRRWLREFLRVQAIYSDEQVEHLQSEAFARAKQSSRSLKDVMDELTTRRKELAAGHQSSEWMRQQRQKYYQAYRQEQVAAREAAMRASARRSASRPRPNTPVVKKREYRRSPPLISSRDVARWSVMSNFWSRR